MKESPFIAVLKRELDRMVSRRIYFASCIVLPLFSIFFMATIFGNGQMENLPVGVVDGDNTATSREIIRMTEAVPTFRIIRHYADEAEARADVQRKSIYGYLSIPSGFEAKVMDGKETALTYYYHYALMSVGSEIHGAFQSLLKSISVVPIVTHAVALGINQEEIESFLLPVTTQNHPLFNPDMDYSVYLTQPFFFVFLQVILLLVTTYSIGSEGKFHTSANWLAVADGNIWVAVTAKLLPYSFIFIVMSILANYVFLVPCIYRWIVVLGVESYFGTIGHCYAGAGGFSVLSFSCVEYYYQYRFHGRIVRRYPWRGYLSGASHVCTGVLCLLSFPVRHFVEIGQNLLYGNYGYAYMWGNVACLLLFLIPPLLLLPHLKRSLISRKYDDIE